MGGNFDEISKRFSELVMIVPSSGYYPEPIKYTFSSFLVESYGGEGAF